MAVLELSLEGGDGSLSVRRFSVQEGISSLFTVSVWARSRNDSLDLDAIVGKSATLRIVAGYKWALMGGARYWTGICSYMEQVQAEPTGLSTYYLRIVPRAWLMTQRRGHRVYQHMSIPDIVDALLGEWGLEKEWQIDRAQYPKLEYKVQYGESDYAFVSRLLEEAGIAFVFPDNDTKGSLLAFSDRLHAGKPRAAPPIHFVDNPSQAAEKEFVTEVRIASEVRPGAHTVRDYDFRNPAFQLFGEATKASSPEDMYEQYQYDPGSFLVEGGKGGDTPVADDKGVARYEQKYGQDLAERVLLSTRADKRSVTFDTNTIDLWPGQIFSIENHPHAEIGAEQKLLVAEFSAQGTPDEEWSMSARALFVDSKVPYRPPIKTPKPTVYGVQSATVVGPKGQEIHTDEFGRVRVQFPWDREGKHDDRSSCWIRVSQGWAGAGFGMIMIPRINQEVLVGFLAGDPDQPIIVGRVYNATNQVPYKLPQHKTRSTWKSDSSLGGGGFNEVMFEDLKGKELVYVQAQKNLRKLVKNDETITVGNNRQKLVVVNETETTGANRTEVTGANRTEITGANRTTVIGGNRSKQIAGDEIERTDGNLVIYIGKNQDIVIKQTKREQIEGDSHLRVKGKRNQRIDGNQSLTVKKNRQEKVGKNHAMEVGEEIHLKAGTALVIEAAKDLTLKGPGGFIRIDAGGITIKGNIVNINSGGSPGSGSGAKPEEPAEAVEAVIEAPEKPVPDNVAVTGLAQ
ncbi:type VI secretion system Vgr family protein [Polyangium mundeleinium]|uniref:Type VI secretion system tip protein TssI/VgrG n=1 Tax=Polyangium mundeleinium TaxID=2995306 RepID=A0ABT5EH53_9BACT|nr:type VI secretion system tip protein TssI/VgrG [Polyangium mundeleinium]MDC0740684.1 type VI secretion system tip protein TssI/VgrG [Polyangium mundeleinium]